MKIVLNGEIREVPDDATVSLLLETLGFQESGVVVERNGEIVDRARFAATPLAENDRLELVRFVGGG